MNFNDFDSLESIAELAVAYEKRIPVLRLCENHEEIHPWAREMCNKIFTDRESLVLYAMGYYLD